MRDVMTNEEAERLESSGREVIHEIEGENDNEVKSVSSGISLETITVEGYGPFQDSITYPLKDRGLILLRGTNRDGESQR